MDKHDSLRRTLLRGAIAGGCALGVPLLIGCKGEQVEESPRAGTDPAASPATPGEPVDTPAGTPGVATEPSDTPSASPGVGGAGKVSQADAQYQNSPKGEEQCSNCQHFIAASNTCALVEGEISPEGWCSLWTKAS